MVMRPDHAHDFYLIGYIEFKEDGVLFQEQNNIKEDDDVDVERQDVKGSAKRSAWARMINKVYGINPLICNRCGSVMQIVAFIMESDQIDRIMQHLKKQGRAPPPIFAQQNIMLYPI